MRWNTGLAWVSEGREVVRRCCATTRFSRRCERIAGWGDALFTALALALASVLVEPAGDPARGWVA